VPEAEAEAEAQEQAVLPQGPEAEAEAGFHPSYVATSTHSHPKLQS